MCLSDEKTQGFIYFTLPRHYAAKVTQIILQMPFGANHLFAYDQGLSGRQGCKECQELC